MKQKSKNVILLHSKIHSTIANISQNKIFQKYSKNISVIVEINK